MADTDRLAALRELILADLRDAYGYDNSANVADGIMGILRDAGVTLAPAEGLTSVRASLERLGLPQTTGRIPPEIVHPAPFEEDSAPAEEEKP